MGTMIPKEMKYNLHYSDMWDMCQLEIRELILNILLKFYWAQASGGKFSHIADQLFFHLQIRSDTIASINFNLSFLFIVSVCLKG